MPPKRKASSPFGVVRGSKRARTEFPCSLCTSDSTEGLITTKIIQNKSYKSLTGHLQCVDLIPELKWVQVAEERNLVIKNTKGYKDRLRLPCQVCNESHGAKLQCTSGKCVRAFHINCAQAANKVTFELKPSCESPFTLRCGTHGGHRGQGSSQNEAIRSEAMLYVQPWDPLVINFGGTDGRNEMWAVSVDKESQTVTVTNPTKSGPSIPERTTYIVDWSAVVINDLLKSYIPNNHPNTSMPTPPSSRSPEGQKEIVTIPDSPPPIIDLITPPPISPIVRLKRRSQRPFTLESVPGLLEAVVDCLFEHPWDKHRIMSTNNLIAVLTNETRAYSTP